MNETRLASDGTLIECRSLDKAFGEQVVLDDLDLLIHEGETLVVLGHSGTGKSVLLKHINGLLAPDSGSVWFEGQDLSLLGENEMVHVRRKVGMLFQMGAMFDSLTVGGAAGGSLAPSGLPAMYRSPPRRLTQNGSTLTAA